VLTNYDVGGHAIVSGGNVPLGGGTSFQKKYEIEDSPEVLFKDLTDWSVVEVSGMPEYRYNDRGFSDSVCLFCHMPEEGEAAIPPLPEKAETEFCLGCHGPFDALMVITAGTIVDELGIEGNPHIYVPHDGNQILACHSCHELHALPVPLGHEIPEADIQYCYAACHHEQTFEDCSACH
jgi:predicted CXXCH cytochrome family protein